MDYKIIYDQNMVKIYKVNEHVYYREGNLEQRRQCNGGFIVLDDCSVAIDIPSVDAAHEMLDESMKLFGVPIKHAIITHPHPDHDLGLDVFCKQGDIAFYGGYNAPAEFVTQGLCVPQNYIGVQTTHSITIGGLEIVIEKVPIQAHSPWDVVVYLPLYNLMFTGDLVACEPILYLESCCLKNWIGFLESLGQRGVSSFARGHGGVIDNGYIERQIKYLKALQEVGAYMYENLNVNATDINDEYMGGVLKKLCDDGNTAAKILYETSGAAAYYQMTQFYRYEIAV